MRRGRARSEGFTERIRGLIGGSFKRISRGWNRQPKVVDERDG